MNLEDLEDEDLDALRVAIAAEQERRANLAAIPPQITRLAAQFCDAGGDPAELAAAIDG